MFAHSSKYALKALHYIAKNGSSENRLMAKDIAKAVDIPKPFLSKILKQLALNNFVTSVKGPYGGFYLTDDQLKNSILDVIVELEGRNRFSQCVLNFENCNEKNPCPIHHLVIEEKNGLSQVIKNTLISDLKDNFGY